MSITELLVSAIILVFALFCASSAEFSLRKEENFIGSVKYVVSFLVGLFLILVVYSFSIGGAATTNFGLRSLKYGVPLENVGSIRVGEKYIVIIEHELGGGEKDTRAYWFDTVPPKRFIKVQKGNGYEYVPLAR